MNLVVFMTKGSSLERWKNDGLLAREMLLYQLLSQSGVRVTIISYGGKVDNDISRNYPEIKVCYNFLGLSSNLYEKTLHLLHHKHFVNANIFKTNQTYGGDIAIYASKKYNVPLIWRSGYLWSEFMMHWKGKDSNDYKEALNLEHHLSKHAKLIVVTTNKIKDNIVSNNIEIESKIRVIPNYVDVNYFSPSSNKCKLEMFDVLFVGRLQEQKNVKALLIAIRELGISGVIIGKGKQSQELKIEFSDISHKITWIDVVPSDEIVKYYRKARVFVLPSFFEGHPKVLIEAMSCGLPVLGSRVGGIQEIVKDGVSGWLCETSSDSIKQVLREILNSPDECVYRGENARKYIIENYSINKIVDNEIKVYKELVK